MDNCNIRCVMIVLSLINVFVYGDCKSLQVLEDASFKDKQENLNSTQNILPERKKIVNMP